MIEISRCRNPQRCRNCRAGMSGAERIVLALTPLQKSADAVQLPDRIETVLAAGEDS